MVYQVTAQARGNVKKYAHNKGQGQVNGEMRENILPIDLHGNIYPNNIVKETTWSQVNNNMAMEAGKRNAV